MSTIIRIFFKQTHDSNSASPWPLGIFQLPVGDENFDLENLRGFEPGRQKQVTMLSQVSIQEGAAVHQCHRSGQCGDGIQAVPGWTNRGGIAERDRDLSPL